jgi:hypothetical protein
MIHPSQFSISYLSAIFSGHDMIGCPEPTLKPIIWKNERTDKDDADDESA